jgi:hypothetical protein
MASRAVATAELMREGEYWLVSFDEREVRLRDSKGMGYLAKLLAHPDREFEALALASGSSARSTSPAEIADAGLAPDSTSTARGSSARCQGEARLQAASGGIARRDRSG